MADAGREVGRVEFVFARESRVLLLLVVVFVRDREVLVGGFSRDGDLASS
jgi:hypothetical protein